MPDWLDGIGEEIDATSINGVIAEDTDETPYPWDFEGDYPEEAEGDDDDEDEPEWDDE